MYFFKLTVKKENGKELMFMKMLTEKKKHISIKSLVPVNFVSNGTCFGQKQVDGVLTTPKLSPDSLLGF